MAPDFRDDLARLPLPLAQLLARAHSAKDARSRHDNTFYLFEALIKLAVMPATAAYLRGLAQGQPRCETLQRQLACLALPSLGQWTGMLRELGRYFSSLADAASLPLGRLGTQLNEPLRDRPGLLALYRRIKNGPDGQPGGDTTCSILQVLDALVQYRNGVFGHGGPRFEKFYEEDMGPLFLPAAREALADGVLDWLGPRGSRLVHLTGLRPGEGGVEVGLRELTGTQAGRLPPLLLPGETAEGLAADRVAVLWPGWPVPLVLDPLVRYRETDVAEELLFLNRERNGRAVEYLSYTTGRTERDRSTATALANLLARITGRAIDEAALLELGERSLAETPSLEGLLGPPAPAATRRGGYEILGELGRGGMGVVYLARQASLGRLVALKMLPADLAGDPAALARFQREVRALSRCEHPNIVKVLAGGTMPDGQLFYTMEYVPGSDLEQVRRELSAAAAPTRLDRLSATTWADAVRTASRKQRQRLRPAPDAGDGPAVPVLPAAPELPLADDGSESYARRIATLVRDAARALQAVHEQQIIHRDVKPANLMLTPDGGRIVLMDFGLAKGPGTTLTASRQGGFLGTLRYAAPEQLSAAEAVGPAADVRALGVTLWELLARRPLFGDAADEKDLARRVLEEDVPRLRRLDPLIDRDLEAIAARATERSAASRIATAGQLADYLQLYLDGRTLPIRPPGVVELAGRWLRRRKAWVATAVLLLLLAGGVTAALLLWDRSERRRERQRQDNVAALAHSSEVDEQMGLAELRGDRWASAEQIFAKATARLEDEPELAAVHARLAARRDRVRLLNAFIRQSDLAERLAARERDVPALAAAAAGLDRLGVLAGPDDWWQRLPADDLTELQAGRFRQEVQRLMLLLAGLYGKSDLRGLSSGKTPQNGRTALEVLRRAQQFNPAYSAAILEQVYRKVLGQPNPGRLALEEPVHEVDFYFSGLLHGWLTLKLDPFLEEFVRRQGAALDIKGLDLKTPLATSERHLRAAARLDPQHYWTHAWLSLFLTEAKRFPDAELAANACLALRRGYGYGYVLRATALEGQIERAGAKDKKDLRRRALADLDTALHHEPQDDLLYVHRGNLFVLREEYGRAIEDLTRAIRLSPDEPTYYGHRGHALYENREYARAVDDFTQAVRLEPKNPLWFANRASNYLELNHLDAAAADCDRALRLDPKSAFAHCIRGQVRQKQQKLDAAVADFGAAVRLGPEDAEHHWRRGYVYYLKGEYDSAIRDCTEAIRRDPEYRAAFNDRGLAYREKGEWDRSIADFSAAIRLNPKAALHYGNRAYSYFRMGKLDEALADCDTVNRLDPKEAGSYNTRGLVLAERKDYRRAAEEYGRAIALNDRRPYYYSNRAYAYLALGKIDEGLKDCTAALHLNAALGDAYNHRGLLLAARKEHRAAVAAYAEAIRLEPRRAQFFANRALSLFRLGEYRPAVDDWNQAIRLDAHNPGFHSERAYVYLFLREYNKGLADCAAALAIDPQFAVAYNDRGLLLGAMKKDAAALAAYTEAIRLRPDNVQYHVNRARVYRRMRDYDRCLADLSRAIELGRGTAALYNERANVHFTRAAYDRAEADYGRAVRLAPANAVYRGNRGVTRSLLKQWQPALLDYNEAIRLDPRDLFTYRKRGEAYLALDQPERAVADFAAIIARDRKDAAAHRALAELHRRAEAWQLAAASYAEALRLRPHDEWGWYFLGECYAEQGEWARAGDAIGRAVEQQPDPVWNKIWRESHGQVLLAAGDPAAFEAVCGSLRCDHAARPDDLPLGLAAVWLGVLKTQPPRPAAELLATAERLVASRPGAALEKAALGAASFRVGRPEAVKHLEEAVRLQGQGGEPDTLFFLALARQRQNKPDRARQAFDAAVAAVDSRTLEKPLPPWEHRLRWQLLRQQAEAALKTTSP